MYVLNFEYSQSFIPGQSKMISKLSRGWCMDRIEFYDLTCNTHLNGMVDEALVVDQPIPEETTLANTDVYEMRELETSAHAFEVETQASGQHSMLIGRAWAAIKATKSYWTSLNPMTRTILCSGLIIDCGVTAGTATHVLPWFVWLATPVVKLLVFRVLPERIRRGFVTNVISRFRRVHNKRLLPLFRTSWRWKTMIPFRSPKFGVTNHAHPEAANLRCQATTSVQGFIEFYNRTNGETTEDELKRYDVATSSREAKWCPDGERLLFDGSDIRQNFRYDDIVDNHIVTMIDVDYHITDWSRYQGSPIIMYTRIPDAVAGRTTNGYFALGIDKDGEPIMREEVEGGAVWTSGVWDYSPDIVIIESAYRTQFTQYNVEKVAQPDSKGRFIVALIPAVTVYMPRWLFNGLFRLWGLGFSEKYEPLKHIDNLESVGPFTLGRFTRGGKDLVDLRHTRSHDGEFTELPFRYYQTVKMNGVIDAKLNTPANIEFAIDKCLTKGEKASTNRFSPGIMANKAIWVNYFSLGHNFTKNPISINYVYDEPEDGPLFSSGKTVGKIVAEPIVTQTVVTPTVGQTNERAAAVHRVLNVRNTVEPTSEYDKYAQEFTGKVTWKADLTRHGVQNVIDSQTRASQKVRNTQYQRRGVGSKAKCQAFMKKECYVEPKPPRMISGVQTEDTINFGTYMFAVKKHLMKFHWFMPGRKPAQTTQAIHYYCCGRKEVVETDFSKWDGTQSKWMRGVEAGIYTRLFPRDHELAKYVERDQDLDASTPNGVFYQTGSARLSGSQSTTVGNSLMNAFVAFCAYRKAGHSVNVAFGMMGPKFGDDGIDDRSGKFEEVCKDLGLKIKLKVMKTCDHVNFCGRIYIAPRTHQTSVFDVMKGLMSLPVIVHNGEDAHKSKVNGYLAQDPKTPLLSHYARALKRIYKYDNCIREESMDRNSFWKVKDGAYPYDEAAVTMTLDVLSRRLGISPGEIVRLAAALDAAESVDDIKRMTKINNTLKLESSAPVRFIEEGDRPVGTLAIDLRRAGSQQSEI